VAPALSPELTSNPGYRAAEAYIRPSPIGTVGKLLQSGFDLRNCTFTFKLVAEKPTAENKPTEIFLPECHFPKDKCTVEVSGGKWSIGHFDEDCGLAQKLKWWHAEGEQMIKVTGMKMNLQSNPAGGAGEEELGYLDQCQETTYGDKCSMM
jgi:hypothetical protein